MGHEFLARTCHSGNTSMRRSTRSTGPRISLFKGFSVTAARARLTTRGRTRVRPRVVMRGISKVVLSTIL